MNYRIINLKTQKGKNLNGKICQILESNFAEDRLNVRLINSIDTSIYRIKRENLETFQNFSNFKQVIHSNKDEEKKLKEFMLKYKLDVTDIDQPLIRAWFQQTHPKKCYHKDGTIALLTKNDFDRQKEHKNPQMIDYIYTVVKQRRKGKALQILQQIKKNEQMSAICSSKQSIMLFIKAGFHRAKFQPMGDLLTVMRYP